MRGDCILKIKKSIIATIKPKGIINTEGVTEHTAEINKSIERNIRINERKIAQGLKRAQSIQTK